MTTQTPAEPDTTITRTIVALAASQSLPYTQLAQQCGMSVATSSRRRKLGGWTAVEVATFARRLGCSVNDLYTGMDGRLLGGNRDVTHEYLRSLMSDADTPGDNVVPIRTRTQARTPLHNAA